MCFHFHFYLNVLLLFFFAFWIVIHFDFFTSMKNKWVVCFAFAWTDVDCNWVFGMFVLLMWFIGQGWVCCRLAASCCRPIIVGCGLKAAGYYDMLCRVFFYCRGLWPVAWWWSCGHVVQVWYGKVVGDVLTCCAGLDVGLWCALVQQDASV